MLKRAAALTFLASLAVVALVAQPQPGVGVFTSLDITNGIESGSGNVTLTDSTGKVPGAALAGTPSDITYSAGNFTGSGTITWTVESGDVLSNHYVEFGKTMLWTFAVGTTTVAGTGEQLRITIPNSRTAAKASSGACVGSDNASVVSVFGQVVSGNTYLQLTKDVNGGNWSAATNTTQVRCTVMVFTQ
ncbi:MAG: hypothetical protein ACYC2H_01265 [Thermoplasmatota archaeon]